MKLRIVIAEGETLPGRWWGVGQWLPAEARVVCYPIPLNVLVRGALLVRWWLASPWSSHSRKERIEWLEIHVEDARQGARDWRELHDKVADQRDGALQLAREQGETIQVMRSKLLEKSSCPLCGPEEPT